MKRATITIPHDLEVEVAAFLRAQDPPPTLTALVQSALRQYLGNRRLEEREYRPAKTRLSITPAARGSGVSDVSEHHDRYLAEERPGTTTTTLRSASENIRIRASPLSTESSPPSPTG